MEFVMNGYAPLNVCASIEADSEEEAREQFEEMLQEGIYIDPRGGMHFYNDDIEVSDLLMDDYRPEHTIIDEIND